MKILLILFLSFNLFAEKEKKLDCWNYAGLMTCFDCEMFGKGQGFKCYQEELKFWLKKHRNKQDQFFIKYLLENTNDYLEAYKLCYLICDFIKFKDGDPLKNYNKE